MPPRKTAKPSPPARPFLKWAGGKGKLISQFEPLLPEELAEGKIATYIEPFLGGGAMFFYLAQEYGFKKVFLYDLNAELVLAYQVVQEKTEQLIKSLGEISDNYHRRDDNGRRKFYYQVREDFNLGPPRTFAPKRLCKDDILRVARLLFLNKTCYNGLFRLNSKGEFNVPFGRYKNPTILDADNLHACSRVLRKAVIAVKDFGELAPANPTETFIYFDPPYRPLSATSNFTTYRGAGFDDAEQYRLAKVFSRLAQEGAKLMLSNSDPKNMNPDDNFFDQLYGDFNVHRVHATRMINSKAARRNAISELLITNYS